jgi:hypothetical protein
VNNNTVHLVDNNFAKPLFDFQGNTPGLKIELNCVSSEPTLDEITLEDFSQKINRRTLLGLNLNFKSIDFSSVDVGQAMRGPCLDIYSQDELGVIQ